MIERLDALIRTSGWLDTYMSPATVTALLTLAAHQQLTVRRDGGWAIVLFQLAGRHSDVLEELCNKLSEAMATGDSTSHTHILPHYFSHTLSTNPTLDFTSHTYSIALSHIPSPSTPQAILLLLLLVEAAMPITGKIPL